MYYHFISRDGVSVRYGVFKAPEASGVVILLNGRSEFMEKYHETITEFIHLGYDVYSMDWRGQGLSDRMLKNPRKGFVGSFDDYVWDLSYFIDNIVKPNVNRPHVLLAHSMGGHIAARYLEEYPGTLKKAVLLSPMIRFSTGKLPYAAAKMIAVTAHYFGLDHHYLAGAGDTPQFGERFENNRLTSDKERFYDEYKLLEENPSLGLGGVTYGWLYAAFLSTEKLYRNAGNIKSDCLMMFAEKDELVDNAAILEMVKRIPNCEIFEVKGARHEILKEKDEIRNLFWERFQDFMTT